MSPSQTAMYWREWAKVRKMLILVACFSPADADAERGKITEEALGSNKSSKALTNKDFDKLLDAFGKYLVLIAGPQGGPSREASQPQRRLIWAIEQLGLDDDYLDAIAADQFGASAWRALSERHMTSFRFTAVNRAAARKRGLMPTD